MKSIIDATISHYHCKVCGNTISERDISIVESESRGMNLEIRCSHCHDVANIKAEINVIGSPMDLEKLSQATAEISRMIEREKATTSSTFAKLIQDEDILQLRNRLKQTASVKDLFN